MNTTPNDKIWVDRKNCRIILPRYFPRKHHSETFRRLVRRRGRNGLKIEVCANFKDWFMTRPVINITTIAFGKRCLEYRLISKRVLDRELMMSGKYPLTYPEDLLLIIADVDVVNFLFRARRHVSVFMIDRFGDVCRVTISFDEDTVSLSATDVNQLNHRYDHHKMIRPGTLLLWSANLPD